MDLERQATASGRGRVFFDNAFDQRTATTGRNPLRFSRVAESYFGPPASFG